MKLQGFPETIASEKTLIDSQYKNSENGLNYEITFLWLSVTGCSACIQMEELLIRFEQKFPKRIIKRNAE